MTKARPPMANDRRLFSNYPASKRGERPSIAGACAPISNARCSMTKARPSIAKAGLPMGDACPPISAARRSIHEACPQLAGERAFGSSDRAVGSGEGGLGSDERGFGCVERGFGASERGFGSGVRGLGASERAFGADYRPHLADDLTLWPGEIALGSSERPLSPEMLRPRISPRPCCVTEPSRRALTTLDHCMLGDCAESSQRAGGGNRTHTGFRPERCESSASAVPPHPHPS
jgi:hypothetical protein